MVNLKHMKSVYLAAVNLCVHGYETGWSRLRSGNMVITWTFRWSNSDTQWSAMDIPVYSLSCWQTDLYTFTIFCVFQPKACAQHYSVFLVVNDIFRWELLFYLFDAFFQKNSLKDSFSACVCVRAHVLQVFPQASWRDRVCPLSYSHIYQVFPEGTVHGATSGSSWFLIYFFLH